MKFFKSFLTVLILILALSFGFLFSSFNSSSGFDPAADSLATTPEPTAEPAPTAPAATATPLPSEESPEPESEELKIALTPYNGEYTVFTVLPGESVSLEEFLPPDNVTDIGWVDEDGKLYSGRIECSENLSLRQICAPVFTDGSHSPLLELNGGIFNSNGDVERIELARFFDEYLAAENNESRIGKSGFTDLNTENGLFATGCRLKYYGAADGKDFAADEALTYGDAWAMLSRFVPLPDGTEYYPVKAGDYGYAITCAEYYGWIPEGLEGSDILDENISRLEYVKLLCGILNRSGDSERKQDNVGVILDISAENPGFWLIAEAVIPHSCTGSADEEIWTDSTPSDAEALEPGISVSEGRVFFTKDDGTLAVNEEINGFMYGPDGAYTSGNTELDGLIAEALILSEAESYSDNLDRLREVYYYIVFSGTYRKGNLYEDGGRDWVYDEAISMLSTRKGNCYGFACAFWACARALGYDATVYTGVLNSSTPPNPHGWVEINEDGFNYLCDPEISYQQIKFNNEFADLFMQGSFTYQQWGYERYEGQE